MGYRFRRAAARNVKDQSAIEWRDCLCVALFKVTLNAAWSCAQKSETRMTASVLKQDPDTGCVSRVLFCFNK